MKPTPTHMKSLVAHEASWRWAAGRRAESMNAEIARNEAEEKLRYSAARDRADARSQRAENQRIQQLLASKIGEPLLCDGMRQLVFAFIERFMEKAVPTIESAVPEERRRENDANLVLHVLRAAADVAGEPERILPDYITQAFYQVLDASEQRLEMPENQLADRRDDVVKIHQILFWNKSEEFHYMHRISQDVMRRAR